MKSTKKILFFVHIPKTAGTSFRTVLQKQKSIRMIYYYGEKSPESCKELLSIKPSELNQENELFDDEQYNVLCGHVNYRRYAHCVSEKDVISIVRNPVERIVSEYQHLKRHENYHYSFDEFYKSVVQQNKQLKLLKGLGSKNGALIGLTSHYRFFVELFSAKMNLSMDAISVNNAPPSDAQERLNIAPQSIRAAYELNQKDVLSFFKLVRRFADSVKGLGYNTAPEKGAGWNCRIDGGKRVVGWVSCKAKDCFFIVIKVNNEKRVVVSLDQYRKDIFEKGLSENPVCGFSYPLPLLGAEQGDVVNIAVLGSKHFVRDLIVPTV